MRARHAIFWLSISWEKCVDWTLNIRKNKKALFQRNIKMIYKCISSFSGIIGFFGTMNSILKSTYIYVYFWHYSDLSMYILYNGSWCDWYIDWFNVAPIFTHQCYLLMILLLVYVVHTLIVNSRNLQFRFCAWSHSKSFTNLFVSP